MKKKIKYVLIVARVYENQPMDFDRSDSNPGNTG